MKSKAVFLAVLMILPVLVWAGDDHGRESERLPPVVSGIYRKSCGTCHFAYQPGLLPARSWLKIVDEPGAHPGGDFAFEARIKAEIRSYLVNNSAEKSQAKRSKKILNSLGGSTPVRISEIAYIVHKHNGITPEVFARKTIGSRANCIACHKSAGNGVYDDKDVVIPD